jgi:hypothetical protein
MSSLAPLSPRDIAEQARAEARAEGIPNTTAIVLILVAKALTESLDRNVKLANVAERAEAQSALLHKIVYGSQKGGAA